MLLQNNITLNDQYGITGSPTLLINGVVYNGQRSAEGYKQAICSAYSNPPEECGITLSGSTGTSSGSCE